MLDGVATVIAPAEKFSAPAITLATASVQRHDSYRLLLDHADKIPPIPCAVAHPCDESSLRGAIEAAAAKLMIPILVGPAAKIRGVAQQFGLEIGQLELVDMPHSHAAAAKAVELVRAGKAELLMKGSLHTDELMAEVVAKETGLRTGRRISHVFIMDVPTYPFPLFITDAAINILPDLATKVDIVQNAIDLHLGLGLGEPRVAILSAVETVNPKMPSTLDAAALCKMADRGQIKGGILDGPLALDNAISPEAARIKGIVSPVAGQAQILVVPDLEAGNMLAKNLSFMANADAAGIVLGRPGADHPDQPGRQCPHPDGVLRGGGALCPCAARGRHGSRGMTGVVETLLVVNAGSSSIKFQLFDLIGGDRLQLAFKGQLEGIGTRPHLAAKDAGGTVLIDETYPPDQAARLATRRWAGSRRGWSGGLAACHVRSATGSCMVGRISQHRPWWTTRCWTASSSSCRWPRCTSRTIWRRSGRSAPAIRISPRSPASIPRSTATIPRSPTGSRSRMPGTRRGSAGTAFTACPTSTSPAGCRRSTRSWRKAGWRPAILAPAPRCAPSMPGAASTARWASPPSTVCRWAPAPGSWTQAWSSTCCRQKGSTPGRSSGSSTTMAASRGCRASATTFATCWPATRPVRHARSTISSTGSPARPARWRPRWAGSTASCSPPASASAVRRYEGGSWSVCAGSASSSTRAANERHGPLISTAGSRLKAYVIPTDEEQMIARHTLALLGAAW